MAHNHIWLEWHAVGGHQFHKQGILGNAYIIYHRRKCNYCNGFQEYREMTITR